MAVTEKPFTGLTAKVMIGTGDSAEILGYMSGATLSLTKDIIEILAFGMQYKEKVPAIKDWSLSVDGTAAFVTDGSQTKLYKAFEQATLLTIGIYLNATTYFEGTGYVSSLELEAAPDDKISISSEMAGNNGVVFTVDGTEVDVTTGSGGAGGVGS